MKKLLSRMILSSLVLLSACTLPIQLIEPKVNGVKINFQSNNLTDFTLDQDDNIYVVDNNVIKRIDAKTNELTTIAGKENPDEFPQDENIDGDIKNAKFGKIGLIYYNPKDKNIYFTNNFSDEYFCLRKIENNQVKTIKKNKIPKEDESLLDITSHIGNRMEVNSFDKKNKVLTVEEVNSKKNTYDITNSPDNWSNFEYFTDSNNLLYAKSNYSGRGVQHTVYIKKDNRWLQILHAMGNSIQLAFDSYNNLYVLEDTFRENVDGKKLSGFYSPILLYKIYNSEIIKAKEDVELLDNSHIIGSFDELSETKYLYPIKVSPHGSKVLFFKYKNNKYSLYQVNIRR